MCCDDFISEDYNHLILSNLMPGNICCCPAKLFYMLLQFIAHKWDSNPLKCGSVLFILSTAGAEVTGCNTNGCFLKNEVPVLY